MSVLNADFPARQPDMLHHLSSAVSNTALEDPDSTIKSDAVQEKEEEEEEDIDISGSDLESEDDNTLQNPRISERRRKQNNAFQSWFVFEIGKVLSAPLNALQDVQASRTSNKR